MKSNSIHELMKFEERTHETKRNTTHGPMKENGEITKKKKVFPSLVPDFRS
jgi:hypothetical protein